MRGTILIGGQVVGLDPHTVETYDVPLTAEVIGQRDSQLPTTQSVPCMGALVLPGLVVGHTHLYSGLARGMPGPTDPPSTFRQILERIWWKLDTALDEETLRVSVQIAAIEAIRCGVTCIVDHHESPRFIDGSLDVIAEELDKLGVRAVLTYGATDRHGKDGAKAGLAECERFAKKRKDDPKIRGMIGLHAPFTCSDDTIAAAADAAQRLGVGVHTHAAEGPDDQLAAKERWGARLIPKLRDVGILTRGALLAHCVDIDDEEAEILEDAQSVWVSHQARSNMNNGVGYARHALDLTRTVIGTDGIDNDILEETRAAFFRRREHTGPAVWTDPLLLLARGHEMISQIFDLPFGGLNEGAPADVIVLEYRAPTAMEDFGAHLLFGPAPRVRDVFVAGQPILRNGKMVGVDERSVYARARLIAPALFERMQKD